jgi:hypothetical protein
MTSHGQMKERVSLDGSDKDYLKTLVLAVGSSSTTANDLGLELAVSKHNRTLTENPAAKNRNRIVYLDGPNQFRPVQFPVEPAASVMDGDGRILGHIAPDVTSVEINFGQHKLFNGRDHIIAFAVPTSELGTVTGWIPTKALLPSVELSKFDKEMRIDVRDTPERSDAPEVYKIKCGSPAAWNVVRLKVMPNIADRREKHVAASDYVARPTGVCYLLTSLPGHGGVAADILADGDRFVPDAGVPRVRIPLYLPTDKTDSEARAWRDGSVPHEMEFRYGRVGNRFGWIAVANLGND